MTGCGGGDRSLCCWRTERISARCCSTIHSCGRWLRTGHHSPIFGRGSEPVIQALVDAAALCGSSVAPGIGGITRLCPLPSGNRNSDRRRRDRDAGPAKHRRPCLRRNAVASGRACPVSTKPDSDHAMLLRCPGGSGICFVRVYRRRSVALRTDFTAATGLVALAAA